MNNKENIQSLCFITDEEKEFLVQIISDNYQGKGVIVDAGSFLGASTISLAKGLKISNIKIHSKNTKIIAIDKFIVTENYIRESFIRNGLNSKFGDSFLSIFMENIKNHRDIIDVYPGDLRSVSLENTEIEILFLDIAKDEGLNGFIIKNWFPRLIPGVSYVIHQDFHSPGLPWIATSMGYLCDYFEITNEIVGESMVFKLKNKIPNDVLGKAASIAPFSIEGRKAIKKLRRNLKNVPATVYLLEAIITSKIGLIDESKRFVEKSEFEYENNHQAIPKFEKWNAYVRQQCGLPF